MTGTNLQALLAAVRRRWWRGQFVAAVRWALWGSAGLMLLAVAVHLAARRVPVVAAGWALVALWGSIFAWAASRRPSQAASALWADRHLGGASAFATVLEMRAGLQGSANVQAVRWLEDWAKARVPEALRLLAQRREPMRLSRPLLSLLVSTALASLVLTLPDSAPPSPPPVQPPQPTQSGEPSAAGVAERPVPWVEAPVPAELVSEIARAVRSAQPPAGSERSEAGQAPAAGPAKTDPDAQAAMPEPAARPAGERAAAGPAPPSAAGTPADAAPKAGTAQAAGSGSGRDAGDSPDERADVGVSRVPTGTIAVQRSEAKLRRGPAEKRADMDQGAAYDDELQGHAGAAQGAGLAAAAAIPPAATESTRLTASEASYVQAWMKASTPRR
ncbi:MAG: hypothetical protein Q8K96_18940 [Rubrivivax sp.]|nr:hypothetical protein [Rubrivivax sp.]